MVQTKGGARQLIGSITCIYNLHFNTVLCSQREGQVAAQVNVLRPCVGTMEAVISTRMNTDVYVCLDTTVFTVRKVSIAIIQQCFHNHWYAVYQRKTYINFTYLACMCSFNCFEMSASQIIYAIEPALRTVSQSLIYK